MRILEAGELGRIFEASADRAYWLRLRLHYQREQRDRTRKEDLKADGEDMIDLAAALVTSEEVTRFRLELDTYDTATVAALLDNESELELTRERLERHFARAHGLPDGRRVFKTIDGARVFDEHGQEITCKVVCPDDIDDARPRWERVQPDVDRWARLRQERNALLDYQTRLDNARERLDRSELTRAEFDQLRDDLKTAMPAAIRAHVADMEEAGGPTAASTSDDLDILKDLVPRPFGVGPKPSGPGKMPPRIRHGEFD